jgi:hypothetical protein
METTLEFLRRAFVKTQIAGMQLRQRYPGVEDVHPWTLQDVSGKQFVIGSTTPVVGVWDGSGLLQPLLQVEVATVVRVRLRGEVISERPLAEADDLWLGRAIDDVVAKLQSSGGSI